MTATGPLLISLCWLCCSFWATNAYCCCCCFSLHIFSLFYSIFLTHVLIALHFSRFHIYIYINNWPSRWCHWMSSLFSSLIYLASCCCVFFILSFILFSCMPPISMKINYCVTLSTVAICFCYGMTVRNYSVSAYCDSVSNRAQTEKKQKENEHIITTTINCFHKLIQSYNE